VGHVFHPGHDELHGMTVVVETPGSRTYIGRFDHEDQAGVHLLDVATHDSTDGTSRAEYLARTVKFGVRADRKHLILPRGDITRISRLG
jgi:hypothetical protein